MELMMTKDLLEYKKVQHDIVHKMNQISSEHLKIAFKAKMTHYEISMCKVISDLQSIPIEQIFSKMALFKESSAHILYKKDFSWNGSM
jgi:hypothetical protein